MMKKINRQQEKKKKKRQEKKCIKDAAVTNANKIPIILSGWDALLLFFRGTRQTRINLHHLHSLLKQTLGRRRANTRALIGERERERKKTVCMYVRISPVMSFVARKLFS